MSTVAKSAGSRAHPGLDAPEEAVLLRATELYETTPLHFPDAYLAALAETSDRQVVSFDRALDKIPSITRTSP